MASNCVLSTVHGIDAETDSVSQWRSQKFVMEGVQNRGLVGTGKVVSLRGVSLP